MPQRNHYYRFCSFRLDPRSRILLKEGERIPLTPRMFDLLQYLVEHPGNVISHHEFLDRVWSNVFVTNAVLVQNIAALRRALGRQPSGEDCIETIPKRGYRFVAPVKTDEALPAYEPRRAIAVLPFRVAGEGASGDPSTAREFLSVGLADALSLRLGRFTDVTVRPVASMLGTMIDPSEPVGAGHKLAVHFVVAGWFSIAGDEIAVTVELIRVADAETMWRERFTMTRANTLSIERRIVKRIHQEVAEGSAASGSQGESSLTPNVLAHQAYLRGRYFWNRRTTQDLHKAIECFRQSVKLDPKFGLAHSGLCDSYTQLINLGAVRPAKAVPKAKRAASRSIALSPDASEAHASKGYILAGFDWDWLASEEEFRTAIELNPNNVTVRHWLATLYVVMHQYEKAMAALEDAREIDPLLPILGTTFGMNLYFMNEFERAERQLTAVLELEPAFALAALNLGRVYLMQRRYPEALDQFSMANRRFNTSLTEAELAAATVLARGKQEGLSRLDELLARRKKEYVSPYGLAFVFEALGEQRQVHSLLEEAFEEHSISMMWFSIEPRFAAIRETPFGRKLMRGANLLPMVARNHSGAPRRLSR